MPIPFFTVFFIAVMFAVPVWAQDSANGFDIPPSTQTFNIDSAVQATHPMLRMTPDKAELIRIERDAVSVVVGNPTHLSVLLDTPKLLVLIPKVPGATHFSVLDQSGDIVMQRHVIVAAPQEKYVRIRRACINTETDSGCRNTSVFFCPDICHEIAVDSGEEAASETELPEETPAGPIPQDLSSDG